MAAPDRSWTVMPTLAWFAGFVIVGLWMLDGNLDALAGRLVAKRAPITQHTAGPAFTAPPATTVAEADDEPPAAPLAPPPPGSHESVR